MKISWKIFFRIFLLILGRFRWRMTLLATDVTLSERSKLRFVFQNDFYLIKEKKFLFERRIFWSVIDEHFGFLTENWVRTRMYRKTLWIVFSGKVNKYFHHDLMMFYLCSSMNHWFRSNFHEVLWTLLAFLPSVVCIFRQSKLEDVAVERQDEKKLNQDETIEAWTRSERNFFIGILSKIFTWELSIFLDVIDESKNFWISSSHIYTIRRKNHSSC